MNADNCLYARPARLELDEERESSLRLSRDSGMAVLGHDCPLSNKRSGRRRNSWCVQTGRTSRNGKGWDEPEVSYTFTCASDFAVVVLGG